MKKIRVLMVEVSCVMQVLVKESIREEAKGLYVDIEIGGFGNACRL